MKVLAVGGGSGGHVTPVVAVLTEIKRLHPDAKISFWCDFHFADNAKKLVSVLDDNIKVKRIVAGKLRRYHHLTLWQQLTWPKLVFLNLRDIILVSIGFLQSLAMLIISRPDVVFTKGGYVCLPVGMAAKILGIPLVIHDSDAHPGLTNRILARYAKYIATGAPLEYYNYPTDRSFYTGIPIAPDFHPVSVKEQREAKAKWQVPQEKTLIVVTGGGLGAQRINLAIAKILHRLLEKHSVILLSGSGQYDEMRALTPENTQNYQLYPFVAGEMASLLTAADIVVARAGATTMLELAALEKPTIVIPNGRLSGGHQLKNAKVYEDAKAAVILNENDIDTNPELILDSIISLENNPIATHKMALRLAEFARPDAALDVAKLILKAAK